MYKLIGKVVVMLGVSALVTGATMAFKLKKDMIQELSRVLGTRWDELNDNQKNILTNDAVKAYGKYSSSSKGIQVSKRFSNYIEFVRDKVNAGSPDECSVKDFETCKPY